MAGGGGGEAAGGGGGGGGEEHWQAAVGRVLREAAADGREVELVAKVGYYYDEKGGDVQEGLQVAPGFAHRLDAEFVRAQVGEARERLQVECIDTLCVQSPEHVLERHFRPLWTAEKAVTEEVKEQAQADLRRTLTEVFAVLEEERLQGTIGGFAVSSNALAADREDPLHLPLSTVFACAREAGTAAGVGGVGGLSTVMLPVNLFEPRGLLVAADARSANVRVAAQRVLTAVHESASLALVDESALTPPDKYVQASQTALGRFAFELPADRVPTEEEKETAEACKFLREMILGLNMQLANISSMAEYERILSTVTPQIADKFEELDEESAAVLQTFFEQFGEMCRYTCATRTRTLVESAACPTGPHKLADDESVQHYALRWVMQSAHVDLALVGMTTTQQVDENLAVARLFT